MAHAKDSFLVEHLLKKYWTDECELLGSDVVTEVASGEVHFIEPDDAHRADLKKYLEILLLAASLIATTTDVVQKFVDNRQQLDTHAIKIEVLCRQPQATLLPPQRVDGVITDIVEHMYK